ncbi:calcium activated potassium channel subunit [Echinococcus multilocularis]|uniref:Calcium activated potassium channel subunit n=1 Tax=Echinococcus multilocularis TaxID=6211 RepID=A0A068XXV2_ECHMU|nr:calcium activated potassium channel subunit [Echinococcus multilocularis]
MGRTEDAARDSLPMGKTHQHYHTSSHKVFSRLRKKYCSGTCLKFVYLACATLISASVIIECILAHLVITPYISESVFESGVCFLYYTATGKRVKCENKCSKDRSAFPCANVQVIYIPAPRTQENHIPGIIEAIRHRNPTVRQYLEVRQARLLYLYDYFSTYAAYKADKCSTSPCNRREADNVETVDQYLRELHATGLMPCYALPMRAEFSKEMHNWRGRFNALTMPAKIIGSPESRREEESEVEADIDNFHILPAANAPTFLPLLTIEWLREGANLSKAEMTSSRRLLHLPPPAQGELSAAALMHRLYPDTLLFHSLFWPLAIILCGLLLIALAYAVDGCKVWRTDMTVIA